MANLPVIHNTDKWIEANKKDFLPPVCNKMMHNDGQMKAFFVGGPNQRKDYHIEEGEELFYMLKGDMCLKVVEHGKHRDVPIREGELFLLPARVAHSPQRQVDTIGLVLERERTQEELDGLRYYQEESGSPTLDSLYEEWFYCDDLGSQLGPIIKRYFASEQFKTGKPLPDTIPAQPPIILDSEVSLTEPFNLKSWLDTNRSDLDSQGSIRLFGDHYQFDVCVYGRGENSGCCNVAETWIWQLEGQSTVTTGGTDYVLKANDTMLIKKGESYTTKREQGGVCMICFQDPTKKKSK